MNKNIFFLLGMISIPVFSMDQPQEDVRSLWLPRELIPKMLEDIYSEQYCHLPQMDFDKYCSVLAQVNKALSEDVPYQFIRLTWNRNFHSPLSHIVDRRFCNPQRKDQCLIIAKKLLQNDFSPNYQWHHQALTPFQAAARQKDIEIVQLFLEHGGDPFKTTNHWIPQGPVLELNAFHYANDDLTEASQLNTQPSGWLTNMWNEVQREKAQNAHVSGVLLLQLEDTMEVEDK